MGESIVGSHTCFWCVGDDVILPNIICLVDDIEFMKESYVCLDLGCAMDMTSDEVFDGETGNCKSDKHKDGCRGESALDLVELKGEKHKLVTSHGSKCLDTNIVGIFDSCSYT
ncbi:hypothetical protein O6H91_15G086000 [Diphasiastrum complanatum]|uniref:Uncharacterized protein n=1 Tax=Diphasiastrum complanatum TaxID=34168 RepID=A0ACC2BKK9_DIPCM|nr:hypothetical protein O6H91_15G086000 [Diphasiastrum complanatum]